MSEKNKKEMMETALEVLAGANQCAEHVTDISDTDVAEALYAEMEYEDGSSGLAVVKLTNGQYAVIEQWEDTSGHG